MTTDAKWKEILSRKIDSADAWQAASTEAGKQPDYFKRNWSMPSGYVSGNYLPEGGAADYSKWQDTYWYMREFMRQTFGVYPPKPDVLDLVISGFNLGAYCIHVAKDDPFMVAYTPSAEDGKRDKQLRTSFGKCLRKLCLLLTDEHIAKLDAAFRSAQDPRFWIATDGDEIERVYTKMQGDSGCMRYPTSHFYNSKDKSLIHPSRIYEAPGMGVAYLQDEAGEVKARSVVWTNPADETDKRYVRIYGDRALKNKLEAAGYKMRDLAGAKLKAKPYLKEKGMYQMPYLDGPGGDQGRNDGVYGFIDAAEPQYVVLCGYSRMEKLQTAFANDGFRCDRFKSTSAVVHISTVDLTTLKFTCPLTNKEYDRSEVSSSMAWVDDKIQRVASAAVPTTWLQARKFNEQGGIDSFFAPKEWVTANCFENSYYYWFDSAKERTHCGLVKPSARFGYDDSKYVSVYDYTEYTDPADNTSHWILRKDTVCVLLDPESNEQTLLPRSVAEAMRKAKEIVRLAPIGTRTMAAVAGHKYVHVTPSGKRVVQGVHEIRKMLDGRYDFVRNLEHGSFLGRDAWYPKDTQLADYLLTIETEAALAPTKAALSSFFRNLVDDYSNNNTTANATQRALSQIERTIRAGVNGYSFSLNGARLTRTGAPYTPAKFKAAVDRINEMTDDQIEEEVWPGAVPCARGWAKLMPVIVDWMVAEYDSALRAAGRPDSVITDGYQRFPLSAAHTEIPPVSVAEVVDTINGLMASRCS